MKHLRSSFIKALLLFFFVTIFNQSFTQTQYLSISEGLQDFQNQDCIPHREISYTENGLEFSYKFDGAIVKQKKEKEQTFHYILMKGFSYLSVVGKPMLPSDLELVAAPKNSKIKIKIENAEFIDFKDYTIHPSLEPATDTYGDPEPEFEINEEFYKKDIFYPQSIVQLTDMQKIRGIGLGMLRICPMQYNPAKKILRVYKNIKYTVEFVGGSKSFSACSIENSLSFTNFLKNLVVNSKQIPDGIDVNIKTFDSARCDYILITHDSLLNSANKLADWKRQLGYTVDVVSSHSWTSDQIKAEIHSRYENWNPKPDYFLMLGDNDADFAVPAEMHQAPDGSQYFASDLYYACMDGEDDYIPDMFKGRITARTKKDAESIVQKIIDYESNPINDPDFYSTALHCVQYQDSDNDGYADRRFCHTSEDVRGYLRANYNYYVEMVYKTYSTSPIESRRFNNDYFSNGELLPIELRQMFFNWNGGTEDIDTKIEEGKFYVLHRDHGYNAGFGWATPSYTLPDLDSLNNGDKRPVVFSFNCYSGEYSQTECFAEKLLRIDGGAVGVVAASCYSLSGHNDAIVSGIFNGIWSEPGLVFEYGSGGISNPPAPPYYNEKRMGNVLNYGLMRMLDTWSEWGDLFEYSHMIMHWFGDPAMRMWTSNPWDSIIVAEHENQINSLLHTFEISNSSPYALATITKQGSLIGKTVLNELGEGSIEYNIDNSIDSVTITISKENCKPYIQKIEVVELTPTYNVLFQVSDSYSNEYIENANISINSENFVTNGSGEASIILESGIYDYEVSALGYLDYISTIDIDDSNLTEPIELIPDNINEIQKETLKIYPNPTKRFVYVLAPENLNSFSIKIFNSHTQVVLQKDYSSFDKSVIKLNVKEFNAGIYYLELCSSTKIYAAKIVIE